MGAQTKFVQKKKTKQNKTKQYQTILDVICYYLMNIKIIFPGW